MRLALTIRDLDEPNSVPLLVSGDAAVIKIVAQTLFRKISGDKKPAKKSRQKVVRSRLGKEITFREAGGE